MKNYYFLDVSLAHYRTHKICISVGANMANVTLGSDLEESDFGI